MSESSIAESAVRHFVCSEVDVSCLTPLTLQEAQIKRATDNPWPGATNHQSPPSMRQGSFLQSQLELVVYSPTPAKARWPPFRRWLAIERSIRNHQVDSIADDPRLRLSSVECDDRAIARSLEVYFWAPPKRPFIPMRSRLAEGPSYRVRVMLAAVKVLGDSCPHKLLPSTDQ